MRILIIGRTEILYNTIAELSKEHIITGIITAPASPESKKTEKDFEKLSLKLKCNFLNVTKITDETNNFIKKLNSDIGISMNWVSIINNKTLELFPKGILNAHFADLPRFRGNAVVNWAIISGEKKIPLTVHRMEEGSLDSGDIIIQKFLHVSENTTIKDIYEQAEKYIPKLFCKALDKIGSKREQKFLSQRKRNAEAFRCYPRIPGDSRINWNESAVNIDRLIRATTKPYSGAYTFMKDTDGDLKKVFIWKSRVIISRTKDKGVPGHIILNNKNTGESHIFTGKGILGISEVSFSNGKIFKPGNYWKSIRLKFEIDTENEIIYLQNELKEIKKLIKK